MIVKLYGDYREILLVTHLFHTPRKSFGNTRGSPVPNGLWGLDLFVRPPEP